MIANLNSRPEIKPATAIVIDSGHEAEAIIRSGCATPTVIVSQRVWIAISID